MPEQDRRTGPSSEDDALEHLQIERVRDLLSVLPEDRRNVLLMRVVSDLTVEQVAEVIGRSAGAVKQLQRRGLLALREDASKGRVAL